QILDLVRWHGVPLTWVLDQRPIEEIKALSTCTDLRLLGIFALIDFAGRISEDHAETMAKMRHFQEVIVPKAEYEFGKFAQIQEIYSGWNLRHKNAAWKALGQRNVHLLERLLDAEQIEQPPTFGKKVVLALGPALSGKSRYLDDHHGQNFRVNLADYNIGAHLVDDRYAFGRKMIEFKHFLTIYLNRHRTVVLEGRVTHPILRRRLTDMIRDLGVEIDYLVFESALDELLARNGRREAPLEDTLIKTQFEEMKLVHPWEAHRVDYVAV
ncbi:MAG: AAA family ATPase, partial [Bacteroidota bacterium]